jgi:hypothetical protein
MLGWHISVYRLTDGGQSPATFQPPHGTCVAVWQTGWDGLDWLYELATAGKAISLGGGGYPFRFTAVAEHLIPRILDHPPHAREVWGFDEGDVLLPEWKGKTVIVQALARDCRFGEWLLVEAWDES